MNKAITDGLLLMPPPFADGLAVWSSGDGTPGSDTYAGSGPGAFVSADQNFDGCLELLKTEATLRVRYMGETPILPGCYLRVTARVKAVAGVLPEVRIAGTPRQGAVTMSGLVTHGPAVQLQAYGEVVEISAIIGTGQRGGVDMVWQGATHGHLGIDLSGATGGVVRVDDLQVEDVTHIYLRDLLGLVDVRDYGAVGDGVTDDRNAFEAADAASNGREVLVPAGTYFLGSSTTIQSQIRFEGQVVLPSDKALILQRNFDYPSYLDAFGNEEEAFRRAYQALLNFSDHESLDLGGRRIALSKPIDMQAAEGTKSAFEVRRVIRNGQFEPISGPAWDPEVVTSQASYQTSSPTTLSSVTNAANIPVGALVEGPGVGREIYVKEVNIAAQTVTLSQPLYDAVGTQSYTFTRFKYMLDFSGYAKLSGMTLTDIEFQCSGTASAVMLAPAGVSFHIRDCQITRPRNRAVTSIGRGCQDLLIDRTQFLSNEMNLPVAQRETLCFNTNANDVKIRDCRVVRFEHFCVLGGAGTIITGNHWFHGDEVNDGVRKGGLIIANVNPKTMITGNYIDNNMIEWTNEYEAEPENANQYSYGGLTITGNIFTANDVVPWFNWIVVKPYGPGHSLRGLAVTGNVFRTLNGSIDRVENVDTTYSNLDHGLSKNVTFSANVFNGINQETHNPLSMEFTQGGASTIWVIPLGNKLPFSGRARTVEAVVPIGKIKRADGSDVYVQPGVFTEMGASKTEVHLHWPVAVRGKVRLQARMDNPY